MKSPNHIQEMGEPYWYKFLKHFQNWNDLAIIPNFLFALLGEWRC